MEQKSTLKDCIGQSKKLSMSTPNRPSFNDKKEQKGSNLRSSATDLAHLTVELLDIANRTRLTTIALVWECTPT